MTISTGTIVTYKGKYFVATKTLNGLVQILNPLNNKKLMVKLSNLTVTANHMAKTEYEGTEYLVSPKGTIISCKTNRVMKWAFNSPHTIAILNSVKV